MDLLQLHYDLMPEGHYGVIHTRPDGHSEFFQDPQAAKKYISSLKTNVYLGCGYLREMPARGKRGDINYISGIPGLWADVDIKLDENYFRNTDDALKFLKKLPLPPTLIVSTGGGLHPWWLFKETMILVSEQDRLDAQQLTKGWIEWLKAQSGHNLDSVGDLPRVLRVPGTLNYKYNPPRKVSLLWNEGSFFNPADFEEFVNTSNSPKIFEKRSSSYSSPSFADDCAKAIKALEKIDPARCDDYINEKRASWIGVGMALYQLGEVGFAYWKMWSIRSAKYKDGDCEKKWKTFESEREDKITLGSLFYWAQQDAPVKIEMKPFEVREDADVPSLLISRLIDNQLFKNTWLRKRKDFKDDQIEYDRSLIYFALGENLDNQLIADLLIAHRRHNGRAVADALAPGYIEDLILKAKKNREGNNQKDALRNKIIEDSENIGQGEIAPQDRSTLLKQFSDFFGFDDVQFLIFPTSNGPRFKIKTKTTEVNLHDVGAITSQIRFRNAIAGLTRLLPPEVPGKHNWDKYAQLILKLCETEELGAESSDKGLATSIIIEFLNAHPPIDFELLRETERKITGFYSFKDKEQVFIVGPKLQDYLKIHHQDIDRIKMGILLRAAGCVNKSYRLNPLDRKSKKSVWIVPLSLWDDREETES